MTPTALQTATQPKTEIPMPKHTSLRRWTPDEDELLRSSYATDPPGEIAKALDRTSQSIWNRAYKLGLTNSRKVAKTTPLAPANQAVQAVRRWRRKATTRQTELVERPRKRLVGEYFIFKRKPNGKWLCLHGFENSRGMSDFIGSHPNLMERADIMLCKKVTPTKRVTYQFSIE